MKELKPGKLELRGTLAARRIIKAIREGNRGHREFYLRVSPYELRQIEMALKIADKEGQLYRNAAIHLGATSAHIKHAYPVDTYSA